MDKNGYTLPSKKVWKKGESQGKVSEKSGKGVRHWGAKLAPFGAKNWKLLSTNFFWLVY